MASNVQPAKAEKFRCVGFSFIISIQKCKPIGKESPKAVVSDYCLKLKGKADRITFTREQLKTFTRDQKEILVSIKEDYRRSCQ